MSHTVSVSLFLSLLLRLKQNKQNKNLRKATSRRKWGFAHSSPWWGVQDSRSLKQLWSYYICSQKKPAVNAWCCSGSFFQLHSLGYQPRNGVPTVSISVTITQISPRSISQVTLESDGLIRLSITTLPLSAWHGSTPLLKLLLFVPCLLSLRLSHHVKCIPTLKHP